MKTKERKTEIYKIYLEDIEQEMEYSKTIILNEILDSFFKDNTYVKGSNEKKFVTSDSKLFWFDSFKKDKTISKVIMNYVIHNKKIDIVNVENLETTKQKEKNEGDKEKQHFLMNIYDKSNKGIIVFENIMQGISMKTLENEIFNFANKMIEEIYKLINIKLKIVAVPDKGFLDELVQMKRISLLKVTVDTEESTIDEDILFSGDNMAKKEIEIIYKPKPKTSFGSDTIEKYYKNFLNNEKSKKKIKRIILEGRKEAGKIKLDTEGMKLSEYVRAELDDNGIIKSDDIFYKYGELINTRFKDYLKNVILEIESQEGEEKNAE